ncbi:MAG: T9SS type A sorting domain-containing protein [Bacteroidales bacterium]|nr:T9SS type A sorting domain-containing protein [Bacteroidales bacterium]
MKKHITLLLLLLPLFMAGQSNFPLVKDNALWHEGCFFSAGGPGPYGYEGAWFFMSGDTLLAGENCNKVFMVDYDSIAISNEVYVGAMYEDSLQRVYFVRDSAFTGYYHPEFHPDFKADSAIMLYDFSLTEGDTFFIPNRRDSVIIVAKIDSANINGQYRKRLEFTNWDVWIEGLGSTSGLMFPTLHNEIELHYELHCYQDKEIFWTNPNLHGSCFTVGVKEKDQEMSSFRIFPNPALDIIFITIEQKSVYSVEIFNLAGQMIFSKEVNEQQLRVNVSGWDPGLYFVQLSTEKGIIFRKVIVTGKDK